MAWRNPVYSYKHVGRDIGAAKITASTGTILAAYPSSFLIDDRLQTQCRFTADNPNTLLFDLSAVTPYAIDRMVIFNHNIGDNASTTTIDVYAADDSGMATNASEIGTVDVLTGTTAPIDIDLTSNSQDYIEVRFVTAGVIPRIGQLMLTKRIETTRGPEQGWPDGWVQNTLQLDSGASVQLGAARRRIEYTYNKLGLGTAADLTSLETMIQDVGTHYPIAVRTAYDSDDGGDTLLMKLTDTTDSSIDSYTYSLARSRQLTLPLLQVDT